MGNRAQTILVADRRLSSSGNPETELSNKLATMVTRDARVAVGYTGLGTFGTFKPDDHIGPPPAGSFRSASWLAETLMEVAAPDYLIDPMLERLAGHATKRFEQLRKRGARDEDRALEVVFAGYKYTRLETVLYLRTVTNFGAPPRPRFSVEVPHPPGYLEDYCVALGAWAALRGEHRGRLHALVKAGATPAGLVDFAVATIRKAALDALAKNSIGQDCTSVVLPLDQASMSIADFHPAKGTNIAYFPTQIDARGGPAGATIILDPVFIAHPKTADPGETWKVRKVGRNQLCPCGSGRKYKRCHGR
jgi:hypothetical protein